MAGIIINEHTLPLEQVIEKYKTQINKEKPATSFGLSEDFAQKRIEEDGPNVLSPPKKKHWYEMYFECLKTLFNLLLIGAGILTYIVYAVNPTSDITNLYLGAILIFVAFLNAFIEFYQLQKSASILESFLNLIPQNCQAVREGKLKAIPAANLAVGDVAFFRVKFNPICRVILTHRNF